MGLRGEPNLGNRGGLSSTGAARSGCDASGDCRRSSSENVFLSPLPPGGADFGGAPFDGVRTGVLTVTLRGLSGLDALIAWLPPDAGFRPLRHHSATAPAV